MFIFITVKQLNAPNVRRINVIQRNCYRRIRVLTFQNRNNSAALELNANIEEHNNAKSFDSHLIFTQHAVSFQDAIEKEYKTK